MSHLKTNIRSRSSLGKKSKAGATWGKKQEQEPEPQPCFKNYLKRAEGLVVESHVAALGQHVVLLVLSKLNRHLNKTNSLKKHIFY